MKAPLAFIVLLTCAFPLTACGEKQEDPPQLSARESAERYVASQQSGDWATFCELLDQKSQESIQSQFVQEDGATAESCLDAIEGSPKKTRDALVKAASVIEVKTVKEQGDQATLVASTPGGDKSLEMVRQDGTWQVILVK